MNKGGDMRDKKNPQLVSRHCFVASFPFITLRVQLVAQQKKIVAG